MKDGYSQLNMTEMPWTCLHVFFASGARIHAIDAAEPGVSETSFAGLLLLVVKSLWVDDMDDAHGLDLLG